MHLSDSKFPPVELPRRAFVQAAAASAALLAGGSQAVRAAPPASAAAAVGIRPGDVVLFQGDSITDAGRSRDHATKANDSAAMGTGYAWLAASQILVGRPGDKLKFYNRGISGNKVPQLAERWQADCLELKPNVLSMLIGVNDIWHQLGGNYEGTPQTYEAAYRELVEATKAALPDVRLVICEPFVLRCGAVNDKWFPQFDEYRAAARRVADGADAAFVPFQEMFDVASQIAPPEQWANDGVHPSANGSALMAHFWQKAVIG